MSAPSCLSKILMVSLVILAVAEYSVGFEPMCDCGLYVPSSHRLVTRVSSVASGCGDAVEPCTCEVKANSCLRRCVEDLNQARPTSSYRSWQRTACTRHAQRQPAPGVPMLAGVDLRHDPNCRIELVFEELPSKPLCCRGTYSTTTFDNMCDW